MTGLIVSIRRPYDAISSNFRAHSYKLRCNQKREFSSLSWPEHLLRDKGTTGLASLRFAFLRTEAILHDVPVLYTAGAVFVLQGRKQGILEDEVYVYDEDHYLAVAVPVPFRMESVASAQRPLLAIYVEFDMTVLTELVTALAGQHAETPIKAKKPRIEPYGTRDRGWHQASSYRTGKPD